ncbi:maleylpyruvate isomerase N-terminal domain-containing protein [Dactylosporangium sp. NPDC051485]|uniref:maleylpyruvate isomerase N-terminal domain-containing protein n=1 Tax=Dactylosporangium sp. NPDC051485 TaxID=3154846 RepID=UPI00343620F5
MERSRLLQCLAADYMRLRDVAGTGLTATVPSCPGWTVADVVRHVGQVYLHKAEVMHAGTWPDPWPPAEIETEEPLALLDRGYGALTHEFSRRGDTDPCQTWHGPDQTVKFWIRRMAQESVIHRLDAELAHHAEPAPIPADLALDGIDEILQLFVAYAAKTWPDDFIAALSGTAGHSIRIEATAPVSPAAPPSAPVTDYGTAATASAATAGPPPAAPLAGSSAGSEIGSSADPDSPSSGSGSSSPAAGSSSSDAAPASADTSPTAPVIAAWLMRTSPDGVVVTALTPPAASTAADAVVTGSPDHLLRWLWARESTPTTDVRSPIQVKGDEEAIKELRTLLTVGTQ